MTTPFNKYLEVKDNYCLAYFGEDKDLVIELIAVRSVIESELKGLNVFLVIKDSFADYAQDRVVLESKMGDLQGKMACFRHLEKKDDLKSLLAESKIAIPEKN